jgi:hypothetical protein
VVLLAGFLGRYVAADLIFQMADTPAAPAWRDSGGLLLEGIARIFDWLAAIEQKQEDGARRAVRDATGMLKASSDKYAKLAEEIKPDRRVSLDSLPAESKARIEDVFRQYKVEAPTDEREAAKLAATEVASLTKELAELTPRIEQGDLVAIQELLTTVTRVQRIGTNVALFFSLAEKPRPMPRPMPRRSE